jgi:CRISPR-associated protein Csd2
LKRKLRNYVQEARSGQKGFDIFIKDKAVLNRAIDQAYKDAGIDLTAPPKDVKKRRTDGEAQDGEIDVGRAMMCATFFDVRTFGAVMSTGANAGQVRGPVQLTFSRSVDPIITLEHSITRMAVAKEEDASKERTMGRKMTVPYAVYVAHGFVSPQLAAAPRGTGFSEDDLALLWEAFGKMFEHDRSAARGLMSLRRLVAFEHESALGSAPAHRLFDLVKVGRKGGAGPARSFEDYEVKVGEAPPGVRILEPVAP